MHQTGYTNFENVVLEGAPGQGKSTITQFLCQALRMALLGKSQDLAAIQQGLRPSQLRIPFRVDLRDLAKWISGIDPFHAKQRALDEQEPRSLEGFLAGQIRFLSGGHSFNVSDLTAVARASHILLALDGFDEVAEIGLRQQLVTEISKGTNRLVAAGGYSVQAIVTSRPAAFAKSVRFPRETWAYFELLPLEQSQIDEYTTKWTKAKGLKDSEALALKQILEVKIKESHTQYLAKNPMQLTILLSLINSRGASLPEKRTAMYDAYMDTFFSRESEKSTVVRDNRELLIDIHRYLAWKLQTSAETGENGSIEHSALRTLLFSYLDREGENTSIVDALFNGIIERVGALVSRVQETYEFEVQPLREYFAARHLYETAPYPSDEQPLAGDKFDRFKALVRNPYWLNVARFYGGCFNKGEILTLVNELTELSRQEPYTWTSHPRSVALMLLGDWVFTQYQPAVRQIIAFITEYPQLRQLLANAEHGNSLWSSLPERSGRGEFVEVLWKRLFTTKLADEQRALANAIQQNTPIDERITRWKAGASMVSLAVWARIGSYLHLYEVASLRDLCLDHIRLNDEILKHLLMMSRYDLLENEAYFERAKSLLLDSMTNGGVGLEQGRFGRLAMIASLTWVSQYTIAQIDETDLPLKYVLERRFGSRFARTVEVIERQADTLAPEEREAAEAYRLFLDTQTSMLSTNLAPWSELVAAFRKAWGDCSAIDRIAFWGAGVRSKGATGSDVPLAEAPDLVEAARYIRLRSGAPMWWREQLLADQPQTERRRLLQLLLQWGTAKTLVKVLDVLDTTLNSLDLGQWDRLIRDYRSGQFGELTNLFELSKSDLTRVRQTSARLNLYLGLRLIPAQRFELAKAMAEMPLIGGGPEGPFALQTLVTQCREATRWKSALPKIETLYAGGASTLTRVDRDYSMPASVALRVSSAPEHYPLALVAFADAQLTAQAGTQAPKLVEVANEEAWFQP
ncbi:NACHT domain-containing protein [Rhizorhabdus histidinilytica]